MNLSKKITVFLFFTFITSAKLFSQTTFQGEYNFRNYNVDNGLPSSETYDIEQDNDGNIWIASDRGVVKYDGQKFVTFTKKDGLSDDVVLQIYKDPLGRIWFVSMVKDLCYYENGEIKSYRYNYQIRKHFKNVDDVEKGILVLKDKSVFLSVNHSGTIKIDSKGKLTKLSQEKGTVHVFSFGEKEIWSVKGNLYAEDKSLPIKIYYSKQHSKSFLVTKDYLNNPRKKLAKCQNTVYLLNNNHIFNLSTKKKIPVFYENQIVHINGINNQLWVGYLSHGIQVYQLKKGKTILTKSLLNNYSVTNSYKDSKGGYWFTTLEAGVFYLPYFEIQGFHQKTGLISDEIKSIYGLQGDIFLGYNGPGVQKITDSKIQMLYPDCQYSIFSQIGNKLLISAINIGVISEDKKISGDWSRDLYCLKKQCLGVCKFVYKINTNGTTEIIHPINNFKLFFAIMQDNENIIWLGDKEGLYYLKNNKVIPFQAKKFKFRVTDLLYHNIWGKVIATRDGGLFVLNKGKITKINGLLKDDITALFIDLSGRLWVGTKKGVNILTKKTGEKIKIDCLTQSQGLYSNEITSIYVDKKNAWIGTKKGLSKVELAYFSRPKGKYTIKLHSIQLKNKSLDLKKELTIPYSEDVVKINFGAIDFITKGLYRYRLNRSSKWTYVDNPQIILLNPEDGIYNLEASFLDENNSWSAVQKVAGFEITPPFWRTSYFKFLIILFLGYLIFLFVRYKKRQFETKQKLLILEQKALFAQMNPHFIFNTLNSIQSFLIYNENDKAEYFLSKFSKLLRQTLHISRNSTVSLEKEIDLLEKYLELEQMRFSNKFSWEFKTKIFHDNLEIKIPNMLIQPYIENSIKHGFTEKREDYKIEIVLTQLDEETLKCEVIDNGIGRKVSLQKKKDNRVLKEHISYGEKITKERLKSYNKSKSTIFGSKVSDILINEVSMGTKVEVIIPIVKG